MSLDALTVKDVTVRTAPKNFEKPITLRFYCVPDIV